MGADDNKLTPFSPKEFTIDSPDSRSPDKSAPTSNESHNGNNFGDKDFAKFSSRYTAGEVNQLHTRSDIDTSPNAQHHTLGYGRNQAAIGDHTHDGTSSRPIGYKLGTVLTGAKGGNVALGNLITMLKQFIDFTDSTT